MAKQIEMQFGMASWVGPGNMDYMGMKGKGVSGQLESTVQHRILGVKSRVSCA